MNKTQPSMHMRQVAHNLGSATTELYAAIEHAQATAGGTNTFEFTSKMALIDRLVVQLRNAFANSLQT